MSNIRIISKEWIRGFRELRVRYVGKRGFQPSYAQGQVWHLVAMNSKHVRVEALMIGCPNCGVPRVLDTQKVTIDGEKVSLDKPVYCAVCGLVYEVKDGKLASMRRVP